MHPLPTCLKQVTDLMTEGNTVKFLWKFGEYKNKENSCLISIWNLSFMVGGEHLPFSLPAFSHPSSGNSASGTL
jgi:hypothetical protein